MGVNGAWSSQVIVATQVIVEGNPDGVFVYNGAPTLGNLIVSIAAQSGTDPYDNAYPQGINATAGVISGVTISGTTFTGTDFVINPSGAFFYSSAPALGNLIASIAPAGGVDTYGNNYLAGLSTYDPVNNVYVSTSKGATTWGVISGGVPQTTLAAGISESTGQAMNIFGPTNSTNTDAARMSLQAGKPGQATGSVTAPYVGIADSAGTSAVDWWLSGTLLKTNNAGSTYAWATPAAAANWSLGSVQMRLDGLDNVAWVGSFSFTGTSVTAAGASTALQSIPALYTPKAQWKVPLVHYTSTSVQKNVAASLLFNTNGTATVQWGDGMASTTHDVNGLATGDIFWVEARVPLGNIP